MPKLCSGGGKKKNGRHKTKTGWNSRYYIWNKPLKEWVKLRSPSQAWMHQILGPEGAGTHLGTGPWGELRKEAQPSVSTAVMSLGSYLGMPLVMENGGNDEEINCISKILNFTWTSLARGDWGCGDKCTGTIGFLNATNWIPTNDNSSMPVECWKY